ncbi:hypothetical protein MMC18_001264 [Xylographa bjoerkii]|nr:hypothetical protein [Xylographa bjoerkii]
MENERRPTIKIDPKGDVILDLTSQEGKTGLLVSSKVLSLVSSVFDTMLNSSFKESLHNQPADKIPIVPLPEDDAEAFTILCKVLHYRMDDFPRVLTPNCLVNIAIIADKYNFVAAITLPSTLWLHSAIANYTFAANCRFANLKKIMLAAYVLDIPDAFSETSWKLLFKHIGPHFDMPGITDHELVAHPANIIGMYSVLPVGKR